MVKIDLAIDSFGEDFFYIAGLEGAGASYCKERLLINMYKMTPTLKVSHFFDTLDSNSSLSTLMISGGTNPGVPHRL